MTGPSGLRSSPVVQKIPTLTTVRRGGRSAVAMPGSCQIHSPAGQARRDRGQKSAERATGNRPAHTSTGKENLMRTEALLCL